MNTQALIDRLLYSVPLFQGFSPLDAQEFLAHTHRLDAPPGTVVIREGEHGQTLYVVISGELDVLRATEGGELRIAGLGPGDTFGEMALLDHRPRSASVRALAPCRLLAFEERDLLQIPAVANKLFRNLARLMAERLRDTNAAVSLMLGDKSTAAPDVVDSTARRIRRLGN